MHVDDRLATVLDARTDGKAAQRVQYRQLLDLVGTTPADARSPLLDAAMVRLAELAECIPHDERARAVGEAGIRLRNPGLVALLAADHPQVALAAIRAARLDPAQWLDLVPALPLAARGLLRVRRDLGPDFEQRLDQLGIAERALPAAEPVTAVAPEPAPNAAQTEADPTEADPGAAPLPAGAPRPQLVHTAPVAPAAAAAPAPAPASPPRQTDGIAAIVRRIEAFRRSREAGGTPQAANDSPRLPLGEQDLASRQVAAFSFFTDSAGRIGWADGTVAPMAVGLMLPAMAGLDAAQSAPLAEAVRRRQPIRAARIRLGGAPALAGEWQLDAAPEFSAEGHFTGYLGRFRRPAPPAALPAFSEADRIRQILHELRTPVNAIQGFAEVIQQQLFGAILHEYRALAASIAGDAARILAGFEELDRFARLESGALVPEPGTADAAATVAAIVRQLETFTASRGSGFTPSLPETALLAPLARAELEHLLWRLLATMAGASRPGEMLALNLTGDESGLRLTVALPESLAGLEDPFDASPPQAGQAISAGVFGSGFTLRLAAAEARAAGGTLLREGAHLVLRLPAGQSAAATARLPTSGMNVSASAG